MRRRQAIDLPEKRILTEKTRYHDKSTCISVVLSIGNSVQFSISGDNTVVVYVVDIQQLKVSGGLNVFKWAPTEIGVAQPLLRVRCYTVPTVL